MSCHEPVGIDLPGERRLIPMELGAGPSSWKRQKKSGKVEIRLTRFSMSIDNGSLILEKPGKTSPALGSLPIEENQFPSIMGRAEIQGRLSRFFRLTIWHELNRVGVFRP